MLQRFQGAQRGAQKCPVWKHAHDAQTAVKPPAYSELFKPYATLETKCMNTSYIGL